MKVLCICEHGNIRSVALAYILKHLFGHEAIAVGWKRITPETMNMLKAWANKIIIFDKEYFLKQISSKEWILFDIGEDVWHDAHAQELTHKLYKELNKHPELWQNK